VAVIGFLTHYLEEQKLTQVQNYFSERPFYDKELFADDAIQDVVIMAHEPELRILLDNLKDNAIKHGFVGHDRCEIQLEIAIEKATMMLELRFSNTGEPLPEGFRLNDYLRNGITSNLATGDGYGGYIIGEIVSSLDGGLSVIDHTKSETAPYIVTTFLIKIPIKEIQYTA
jgi:sensor histidine kinase regulating citrate/malate metabolism